VLAEIMAAQQPFAGEGGVIVPAGVFMLPSQDVLMVYPDGGVDFEKVFKVSAGAGTSWGELGRGVRHDSLPVCPEHRLVMNC
jgi:hypothetical protein